MVGCATVNKDDLEILLNTGNFKERPPEYAVRLLEETCARTGLDWKARHVYLMTRGGKWSVTLSIDGFRLIGAQDATYAGQEGPFWTTSAEGTWTDIPPERAPYASKVGIRKRDGDSSVVTWGVAKYADYKASMMWDKFPSTMIAKCAEMLAWRKAFPGRLGGLYGLEEMAQADKVAAKAVDDREVPSDYASKLDAAGSLDEVKAIGRAISADMSLSADVMQFLHRKYTELKNRYSE